MRLRACYIWLLLCGGALALSGCPGGADSVLPGPVEPEPTAPAATSSPPEALQLGSGGRSASTRYKLDVRVGAQGMSQEMTSPSFRLRLKPRTF
jgi:hypothetical protein